MHSKWNASGRTGEVWEEVQETFASIPEYRTSAALLFAKDYGVPQNRPRVMLVGLRNDVPFKELKPQGDAVDRGYLPPPSENKAPDLVDLLGDLVDPAFVNGGSTLTYPHPARTKIQRSLRTSRDGKTIAKKGDRLTEQDYSKHGPRVVAKFKAMLENGGEIPEAFRTKKFAQRVLPERWGPQGPSITATSLSDDYVHFCQPRNLTVREWARLQMFPDWYQFAGKRTTGGLRRAGNPRVGIFEREVPKYTQIGNAVPVELARRVGVHLAAVLAR
jgi:DNA (cytosine-5)-methyltransferase 1